MVKKGQRRFQSDPVDFGVVGLEDEDVRLDEDELEDLEEAERVEELEVVQLKSTVRVSKKKNLAGSAENGRADQSLGDGEQPDERTEFVGSEIVGDDEFEVERLGELDADDFPDDDDLIDMSEDDEAISAEYLEDDGAELAQIEDLTEEEENLAAHYSSLPFRSLALEQFVQDSRNGYSPAIEAGLVDEFSRVWAAAISSETRFREAKNQYGRVGVNLGYNFSDFTEEPGADLEDVRIEEESLFKAKAVALATGLPALSVATSWDVEPAGSQNTRSFFHRTMVPSQVDTAIEKLRPRSDKNRKVIFRSIAAFYDGKSEIFTEGVCEVAMYFASSRYATIAVASAFDNLFKELWKNFNLHFVDQDKYKPIDEEALEESKKNKLVGGTLLKERILREGRVLNGGILKVSSFLNHMVDAELMNVCGEDLAERLRHTMPNKVLTVEATGLIPALTVGRRLRIPVVFARKSRPITISESYQTLYQSKTKGQLSELIVSREYLCDGDRIILIDDFLAGGSTVEALFKLATMAHARVVGLGVLIEKTKDGGRAFLSGYDVPVESLAKVTILADNTLHVEEGVPKSE